MTLLRCFNAVLIVCLPGLALTALALPSLDYVTGKALFEKNWVFAPASTTASDGLGPYYNARSCQACHAGGGRGMLTSRVVHTNDAVLGRQLQPFTRPGIAAETSFTLQWQDIAAGMRLPRVLFHDAGLAGLDMPMSVRLPPSLAGLGLLAAIPDDTLLAMADGHDTDSNGISGRVNRLPDGRLGRFGWKATDADLRDQVGRALSMDMGLGNPVLPAAQGDCTLSQAACLAAPHGNTAGHDNLEVSEQILQLLLSYVRGLPAPGSAEPASGAARRGAQRFNQVGCEDCHVPAIVVGKTTLRPFTDLLLHDMGPGLTDNLETGGVAGSEWRTAPLWGLGRVTLDSGYLHDGRAATLHEAIVWHDGEAAPARRAYLGLNKAGQEDLIAFLNGL